GLTLGVWDFEPLEVDMRDPGIIKGLRLALLGCREGDRVEAYMTYNMAYGDKTYMYFLPKETPVAIFFSVDKVE
ncbi:MAG: FKBP-type peptidyl-prolyl cis-trans isomerase, partial [Alistipes sp.]|nr:FKBP-type peptidyl-prolyl cis-trans isomerase [Alistipes sp.]